MSQDVQSPHPQTLHGFRYSTSQVWNIELIGLDVQDRRTRFTSNSSQLSLAGQITGRPKHHAQPSGCCHRWPHEVKTGSPPDSPSIACVGSSSSKIEHSNWKEPLVPLHSGPRRRLKKTSTPQHSETMGSCCSRPKNEACLHEEKVRRDLASFPDRF
jgi:hypothetical protein